MILGDELQKYITMNDEVRANIDVAHVPYVIYLSFCRNIHCTTQQPCTEDTDAGTMGLCMQMDKNWLGDRKQRDLSALTSSTV